MRGIRIVGVLCALAMAAQVSQAASLYQWKIEIQQGKDRRGRQRPPKEIGLVLGQVAEAVDAVPLLAGVARSAHLETPAIDGLAALIEGRIEPEQWTATVTQPTRRRRGRPVRAA